jgi:aminomethyltransferase
MGVMGEHLHARAKAGLFDVSHMGQILAYPTGNMEDLALDLERQMPIDVVGLAPMRQRYGMLTDDAGGILDDLMIAHRGDHFLIVVNAACKAADFAQLTGHLRRAKLTMCSDRALLALQGPTAERHWRKLSPKLPPCALWT